MGKGYSDKKVIEILISNCINQGLKHIVISPGSRNAPLILSFSACPTIKCHVVVDERCAAFFALGMAQQLNEPVAIVCTSGTAVLNYAPALAEAFYQNIPIIAITADRPTEWLDQEDGQTINQVNIFQNFTKHSCTLPVDIINQEDEWLTYRSISEAFYYAKERGKGPVHINIPLREPLYGRMSDIKAAREAIIQLKGEAKLSNDQLNELARQISSHPKVMFLIGMREPNNLLNKVVSQFATLPNTVVLTETTSNLFGDQIISTIDRVLATINPQEQEDYTPTLLITLNGPLVSRQIKQFIKRNKPQEHWHIDLFSHHLDPYQALTLNIEAEPAFLLNELLERIGTIKSNYNSLWSNKNSQGKLIHNNYLAKTPWCDLKAFEAIFQHLPSSYQLQLGNSTPVRYGQLFNLPYYETFSNRGTSGIDGSISTAAGAAFASQKPTLLLVGDISALYDSNGFWHKQPINNLKTIIINNSGGGIFRFIQGPAETDELEEFFETSQETDFAHLAALHQINYQKIISLEELTIYLPLFYKSKQCEILEIVTPSKLNAQILRNYFETLKNTI